MLQAAVYLILNTILWATFYAISKEALTRIDPFVDSFYIFEPIWSALLARAYIGESLSPRGYLGGLLIVSRAFLHTWRKVRSPPRPLKAAAAEPTS